MRRAALLAMAAAMLAGPALAQRWEPQRVAELQALDKVNARVSTLRVPVGQPATFGTLTLTVRACHARPTRCTPGPPSCRPPPSW